MTIVGVAPAGFRGTTSLLPASAYVPLAVCGADKESGWLGEQPRKAWS